MKTFFRSSLKMTGAILTSKTLYRIFSKIEPRSFEFYTKIFFDNCVKTHMYTRDIFALDGKQDCGSGRKANEIRDAIENPNALNVYSNNDNFCIGSMMIADKSNEIPSAPNLYYNYKI